jgi:mRNA interferase MazF
MPKDSWIKLSQIRMISVHRLGKKIAALEPDALDQAVEGLLALIS